MQNLFARALTIGATAALPLLQACSNAPAEANGAAGAGEIAGAHVSAEAISTELARASFHVEGMDCGGCVLGTRAALRKLEGVQEADASYEEETGKGSAWAVYDATKVTPEQMMAAIRELGYTPSLVEAEA